MQPGKNIKIFLSFFLGPALFLWLAYSIVQQILHQPHLEASWQAIRDSFGSARILFFLGALLLVPINWGIEALKWQRSIRTISNISLLQSFKAILCGVSFSITMPNRVGEYIGRMIYLPEGSRLRTVSVTLVGSVAQLLITLLAGAVGLILFLPFLEPGLPGGSPNEFRTILPTGLVEQRWLIAISLLTFFILLACYLNVSLLVRVFGKRLQTSRYHYLVEALEHFETRILWKLFFLSAVRYCVFLLQYVLLFYFFGVDVSVENCVLVMTVVFWVMAIIPTIALVEVWLRGEVLLLLMGLFSTNSLGIGFTSVSVWFLNLIVPAIAGSLLILSHRIFKRRRNAKNASSQERQVEIDP